MDKFDLENFPASESAKRMLSYVSNGFYDRSYIGKWLFQVMGMEYDSALEIVEDLQDQFFPETATWGLMYHEIKWGLPVRNNLPYEERRRLIYQKRNYQAPMTPYHMERYLEDVTGSEVHVADVNDPGECGFVAPHPNVFKVCIYGKGALDLREICSVLNKIKQAHTNYTVEVQRRVTGKLYIGTEMVSTPKIVIGNSYAKSIQAIGCQYQASALVTCAKNMIQGRQENGIV